MNTYKYMNKNYDSLEEMFKAWDKSGANRYYSLYINNNRYECKYISLEYLDKCLKSFNNCYTYYKNNTSRGYNYKNADKINISQLDRIEIRNTKGIHGHITGGFIVMSYNGKLIKLS